MKAFVVDGYESKDGLRAVDLRSPKWDPATSSFASASTQPE
jgi:hypothetical protein